MNLIRSAIHRPVTVCMFVVAVLLFGLVSLDRLALNLLPDISYPSLTIQTDYPDAAPEEVESLVTRPIEEAAGVVPGLTRMTSVSRSGQSEVVMEFGWNTNMDLATLEVREKLDFVDFPRDVQKPVILRFDPAHDPIMRIRLSGDTSLSKLRYRADKELKRYLESIEGVAAIKVIGGLQEQIRVEVDEKRLAELGIPITEVTQILGQENLNQATGSLYDLDASYLVRMLNQFRSVEEVERIILRNQDGKTIYLKDVARVWRGTREREIVARLDGKDSVELAVYKEGDANTVTVARALIQELEALKESGRFPENIEYRVVSNQAEFIEHSVSNVLSAALLGGVLATLILFLFLRDLRSTLTIAFCIPISIMATFALMYQTDITLNIMSLGGVALGVGMLVDNAIVVLESVHRHRRPKRKLSEAVYQGTREVGMAVTASTLTTVAVFLPLVFVEGIAGQLFKDQALTITYALLASLLVAVTFIPMLLAAGGRQTPVLEQQSTGRPAPRPLSSRPWLRYLQRATRFTGRMVGQAAHFIFVDIVSVLLTDVRRLSRLTGHSATRLLSPALQKLENGFNRLRAVYPEALGWSLDNKGIVLAFTFCLLALAGWTAVRLGAELIPPLTQGEFTIEVTLPEGTPIERTDALVRTIETEVSGYPEVATVYSSIGGSNENQFARDSERENLAQLYVVMKDRRDEQAEAKVIDRTRGLLESYPDAGHNFSRPTLFSFKTPIEVELYGYDLNDLRAAADRVAAGLERIPGLRDIETSTRLGSPEIHVSFDRERLARLNLEENQIAELLRNKIRGDVASRYREEDRQIDMLVRARESERKTMEDLKRLVINTSASASSTSSQSDGSQPPSALRQTPAEPGKVPILLGSVADIRVERGPSEIRRIRSQRAAVVSAGLVGRDLASVSREIRSELQRLTPEIPANVTMTLAGQNEDLATSYNSLLFALGLAVFLVYLVMASQFESLIHPFIIIFSVPLGMVGVIFSLFLTGTSINVMVILGVIILAGIVVNNAIVLIDYTNQLRAQGISRREALLQAGQVRLRPIVMTTLTTVLGLIPMALAWGEGAEVRAPMAITVMGGLLFSTLLTLIFIPVVYELVDRKSYAAQELPAGVEDDSDGEADRGWQPA